MYTGSIRFELIKITKKFFKMAITFESAMEQLKVMFPTWDEETMSTILISNDYHVERTIEQILSMSGEISAEEVSTTNGPNNTAGSRDAGGNLPMAAPGPGGAKPTDYYHKGRSGSANNNDSGATTRRSSNHRHRRGMKTELPDMFLRPPGYKSQGNIIADEELAMMLMNEDFQRQARELLGEEWREELEGGRNNNNGPNGTAPRRGSSNAQQRGSATGGAAPMQRRDSSVLKSLSEMGTATKNSLSQLAQSFSRSSNNNNNAGSTATTTSTSGGGGIGSRSTSRRASREKSSFRSMDEDEDEVITFGGSSAGRTHMLQNGVANDNDDEEDDPFDSENPLIQYNARNTSNVTIQQNAAGGNKKDK